MSDGRPAPRLKEVRWHCDQGHLITEQWMVPMEIGEFSRRFKAIKNCAVCGSTKLFGGPLRKQKEPA
jgi:hypothetical protein